MKRIFQALLAVLAFSAVSVAFAAEPTINQVYDALRAGHANQAQGMMVEVLRAHPDKAKPHYVEAEVLVKLGRYGDAQAELARAEQIEPGLRFAAPAAVQELRGLIANGANSVAVRPAPVPGALPVQASPEHSFPWGVVLVMLALGGIVFVILRARRNAQVIYAGGGGAGPTPYYGGGQPMPYGAPPMMPMGGGGIGSGIVGGLVTGAAVGAGMVAGEALAHNLMDGGHPGGGVLPQGGQPMLTDNNDLGGQNFGIADSGSWDDGGSGGGGGGSDDWG